MCGFRRTTGKDGTGFRRKGFMAVNGFLVFNDTSITMDEPTNRDDIRCEAGCARRQETRLKGSEMTKVMESRRLTEQGVGMKGPRAPTASRAHHEALATRPEYAWAILTVPDIRLLSQSFGGLHDRGPGNKAAGKFSCLSYFCA
jgi:hypothetical protein